MAKKSWIKGSDKVDEKTAREKQNSPGATGKKARLALTLMGKSQAKGSMTPSERKKVRYGK